MHFVVIRDYKENRKKCSLAPVEKHSDFTFVDLKHPSATPEAIDVSGNVLLYIDGPELSAADARTAACAPLSLVLLDCTWARVGTVLRRVRMPASIRRRSLPRGLRTAYPRVSKLYNDPLHGLASIEALFAASVILDTPRLSLLGGYRWSREFLELNRLTWQRLGWDPPPQWPARAAKGSLR